MWGGGGGGGGGGGYLYVLCPDVGGLKKVPIWQDMLSNTEHTHNEGIFHIIHTCMLWLL